MMAVMRVPPRLLFAVTALGVLCLLYFSSSSRLENNKLPDVNLSESLKNITQSEPARRPAIAASHTIDHLIADAQKTFHDLMSRQSFTLAEAAETYRRVRGRHPPPGFDAWYRYAAENNAVIIEEFWDQIYHDLNPFWALEPALIRTMAKNIDQAAIIIKNRTATSDTNWHWYIITARMITTVAEWLPDMIIPMNRWDEPRVFVPWEQINEYMTAATSAKKITPIKDVIEKGQGWDTNAPNEVEPPEVKWWETTTYTLARHACAPDSHVRQFPGLLDYREVMGWATKPEQRHQHEALYKLYLEPNFVLNTTLETNICHDPLVGGTHGALVRPHIALSSRELLPMFGASKLAVNNEILLPAPMYWDEGDYYMAGEDVDIPWESKIPQGIWRGSATGGLSTPANWQHFHRHRFVAIANGTTARLALNGSHEPFFTPLFKEAAIGTLDHRLQEQLPEWLDSKLDVAFIDLMCEEGSGGWNDSDSSCWYTSPHYEVASQVPMREEFGYKYLPDVDGNGFSGRYRAFLMSTSLPIKATLYREWHDSRLVPWKHFVPMNNHFSDFYRILEYFEGFVVASGTEKVAGRDDMAKQIALDGREWSKKVLRKEDMQIYTLRLLLEYARVTEDNRERLGYIADLR